MKNTIRHLVALMLGMATLLPMQVMADTVSPSDVEINFQDLYLSKSTDCSSPIHVLHNSSASTQNFINSPTLGAGSVPKGTYPCAIVGINSVITLTPAASTTASSPGECQKDVPLTNQICRNGSSSVNPATGATITCVTGTPTEVFGYFSTTGVNSNNQSGLIPSSPLLLSSALVVTGNHTLRFVVDFDNTMIDDGNGGTCQTQAPIMSAR